MTPLRRRAAAARRGRRADLPHRRSSRFRASAPPSTRRSTPRRDRRSRPRRRRRRRSCRCSTACRRTRGSASSGCTRAASRCARSPSASAAPPGHDGGSAEEIRTPGLDRLLWLFLRLLLSKAALDRFLADDEPARRSPRALSSCARISRPRRAGGDERIVTVAAGQHRDGGAAARQLRAREEERAVRLHRAGSDRGQDPGAGRDGGQPAGSRTSSAARSTRRPRACGRPRRRSASCST